MSSNSSSAPADPFSSSFDLSDDQLRFVLRSIDVAIPTASKLPRAALLKRLHKCLNLAEEASRYLPKEGPLDVEGLKPWPKGKQVFDSTQRGTLHEAMMATFAEGQGLDPNIVNRNALISARTHVMALANIVDMGIRTAILQPKDHHQRSAISIRVSTGDASRSRLKATVSSEVTSESPRVAPKKIQPTPAQI